MGKKARLKAIRRASKENTPKETNEERPALPVATSNSETSSTNVVYGSRWQYIAVSLLVAIFFLLFKCFAASPVSGDENIYFYVGRRVFEGLTPYREIFLAHPPGHLLIAALFMASGIFTPFWFKLVSVLPALITVLLVLWIMKRQGLKPLILLITGLLLALSHNFLSVATHFTGANWSTLALVAALACIVANKKATAGILLAFSGLISFHILPAIMGLSVAYLLFYRRESLKTLIYAFVVTLLVHLACLIAFGDPYAEQVFGYHLSKTAMAKGGMSAITRFFHNEYHLATFAFLSLLIYLKQLYGQIQTEGLKAKPNLLYTLVFAATFAQIAGVFSVNRVFTYYLIPLAPLFVIASGLFFKTASQYLQTVKQSNEKLQSKTFKIMGVCLLITICFISGEHLESEMGYYQRQYGEVSTYQWKDSACLPGFVNSSLKAILFNETRRVGDLDCGLKRYFWHESVTENPQALLKFVMEYQNVEGTIFGDASTAPYFALMTGRKITLEQADTNAQLFKSGRIDMKKMLAKLNVDPPALLILNPKRGIASHPWFKNWVQNSYRMVHEVKTVKNKRLQLHLRRDL